MNNRISKSSNLVRISKLANGLSWLIILLFILDFINEIYLIVEYPYEWVALAQKRPILFIVGTVIDEIRILFIGISYWLILKGVSFVLIVLVNIDQYIGLHKGNDLVKNKNIKILYHPESIIKHSKLLSNAAIVSIFLCLFTSVAPINYLHEFVRSLFIGRPDFIHYSWIITLILATLGIGLQSIVYYFSFKSLGMILTKLVDIEGNIRRFST